MIRLTILLVVLSLSVTQAQSVAVWFSTSTHPAFAGHPDPPPLGNRLDIYVKPPADVTIYRFQPEGREAVQVDVSKMFDVGGGWRRFPIPGLPTAPASVQIWELRWSGGVSIPVVVSSSPNSRAPDPVCGPEDFEGNPAVCYRYEVAVLQEGQTHHPFGLPVTVRIVESSLSTANRRTTD